MSDLPVRINLVGHYIGLFHIRILSEQIANLSYIGLLFIQPGHYFLNREHLVTCFATIIGVSFFGGILSHEGQLW